MKEKLLAQLEEDIKYSYESIPEQAEDNDWYDDMNTDEIIDSVMDQDNSLEFEVGYLKGMEYAVSLINKF